MYNDMDDHRAHVHDNGSGVLIYIVGVYMIVITNFICMSHDDISVYSKVFEFNSLGPIADIFTMEFP